MNINQLVQKCVFEKTDLFLLYEANKVRQNLYPGLKVSIVLKEDQGTEKRVIGKIEKILTKSPKHDRGIKVKLDTGEIGRVQKIL